MPIAAKAKQMFKGQESQDDEALQDWSPAKEKTTPRRVKKGKKEQKIISSSARSKTEYKENKKTNSKREWKGGEI